MKSTIIVVLIIGMFLLMPFHQVVSAEVEEVERTVYIQESPDVSYSSVMNIINDTTNRNFTNSALLVNPFINQMDINGGVSCGFLPPAIYQVGGGNASQVNDNLVLASTVEFQRKNLLSGASESWWRCPYRFNGSIADSRSFYMTASIYMVDLPRQVNLTFPHISSGSNGGAIPNIESHASLVFQRTYSNCGNQNTSFIKAINHEVYMPVNDTWNENKPDNFTGLQGDFEYYKRFDYSFVWVNVSAPIYPNETYFVVWDIEDTNMGAYDSGSCYVTASDIGQNGYYRSLVSWCDSSTGFTGTVYELPIDLDIAVVFRIGMGDGVTGMKLDYNDPDFIDHTSSIINPSFEQDASFNSDRAYHFYDSSGLSVGHYNSASTDNWVDIDNTEAIFKVNATGTGSGMIHYNDPTLSEFPYIVRYETSDYSYGISLKAKIKLFPLENSYGNSYGEVIQNSVSVIGFYNLGYTPHALISIVKTTQILNNGSIDHYNVISIQDSATTTGKWALPDNLPNEFYLSLHISLDGTGANDGTTVRIYDVNNPYEPFHSFHTIIPYHIVAGGTAVWVGGGMYYLIKLDPASPLTNIKTSSIDIISFCERDIFGAWSGSGAGFGQAEYPSEQSEINTPVFKSVAPADLNILSLDSIGTTSSNVMTISQARNIPVISGTRRFSASVFYQLRLNNSDLLSSTSGFYAKLYFRLSNNGGATYTTVYNDGNIVDSAWHKLATNFITMANVNRFEIGLQVFFPAVPSNQLANFTNGDWKMGFFDDVRFDSITGGVLKYYTFRQKIDSTDFTSTNYMTFMLPFKHMGADPEYPALVGINFYTSAGAYITGFGSTVDDWFDDFLIIGYKTSLIGSTVAYATIDLFNFGQGSYLFLHDRNSDGYLNTINDFGYNYISEQTQSAPTTVLWDTFFSPYYSLKATEGEWTCSDGAFTTTAFYFVQVSFVQFNDTEPEVISIQMYDVNLEDLDMFTFELQSFGEVYNEKEWLGYLEIKNRPDVFDIIADVFMDFYNWVNSTALGQLLYAIGKFVLDVIDYFVPVLEGALFKIIQAIQFILAYVIYIIGTYAMWVFTNFWILVGKGRTEEGIDQMAEGSANITGALRKIGGGIL